MPTINVQEKSCNIKTEIYLLWLLPFQMYRISQLNLLNKLMISYPSLKILGIIKECSLRILILKEFSTQYYLVFRSWHVF